jgi:TP901-1 family phage major tail protein|tara:strand:+ start:1383 stop:1817 length:435 start_codon:yes stop_codon:yes gene_type:complete
MAILNGTELKVYSTGTTNLVAYAQNCTLNINNTTRDITNKESAGWKESLESLRDWSIDVDGAYAWTSAAGDALTDGVDDLIQDDIIAGRLQVDVIFGDSASQHDVSYSGKAYITSVSLTGGTEDTATYSLTLEGTAALTQSVVV